MTNAASRLRFAFQLVDEGLRIIPKKPARDLIRG
jgi:hypothetical protein